MLKGNVFSIVTGIAFISSSALASDGRVSDEFVQHSTRRDVREMARTQLVMNEIEAHFDDETDLEPSEIARHVYGLLAGADARAFNAAILRIKSQSRENPERGLELSKELAQAWYANTPRVMLHYVKAFGPAVVGAGIGIVPMGTFAGLLYLKPVLGLATDLKKLHDLYLAALATGAAGGSVSALAGKGLKEKWEALRVRQPLLEFRSIYPEAMADIASRHGENWNQFSPPPTNAVGLF